ncbi:MAG: molybdopterin-dependent oxidoreductase [Steroidobacteraceae bacterium]|jgi:isoquinoline 1-oxidoreductase beta subunit|nr:molybdopterin-dependent oxidoreductase [Steroidobacteraceae bacterium]
MERRRFLLVSGLAGSSSLLGLVWGCAPLPARAPATSRAPAAGGMPAGAAAPLEVGAWLALEPGGRVLVQVHKSEMGQGVLTALPMLVAEELDVPFARVEARLAPGALRFRDARGNQTTGYSSSVSSSWLPFRTLGAAARAMLLQAAALRWAVPVARLRTERGEVVDDGDASSPQGAGRSIAAGVATPRRLPYAALLEDARRLPVPDAPPLKAAGRFELIGSRVPRVDTPSKVDGSACFGIDVRLPSMKTAVVARCPHLGGRARGHDPAPALRVPGVERVVPIGSGIAVVARDFWSASRGRDALVVDWDPGPAAGRDSPAHERELVARLGLPGRDARREGDPAALAAAAGGRWVRADYHTPFLAHAAMEPLAATASVGAGRCDLWLGTQAPSRAQDWAAKVTGLAREQVFVHTLPLGGAFGRRGEWDFAVEAVELALACGVPVKVVWSRADDMRHDFYRPATANRLAARLDDTGALRLLTHRVAAPSIARRRSPEALERGHDFLMTQGSADHPYSIEHQLVDYHEVDLGVPVGFWRSVGHSHNGFALECFVDEIAEAAGADPFEWRRARLDGDPRLRAVLELAARESGWGGALPRGSGRGIACMESYGTRVALVAEVRVAEGEVAVRRITCAVDCGQVVHPGIVEQQMESGIVFGLSAALHGEVTFADGAVRQSNFHDYPVLRLPEMPRIDVHRIASDAAPGGCGEPSTPVVAPAVCNAIHAATGQRIRRLPIRLATRPA